MYGVCFDQLRRSVAVGFRREVPQDPLVWAPWNVRFPSTWESTAFDFEKAPHVRGVIERGWNNPAVRKIHLSFATRLCKTSTMLSLVQWVADQSPAPMVLMFPDTGILNAGMEEHVYPMMEQTPVIRRQLPPVHLRNRTAIHFTDCRLRIANAGSRSSVAGYPALYVFKMEVNKIISRKSSEADAYYTIESRCTGYPRGAKIVEEGTPTDTGTCRAYRLLQDETVQQLRYWVPCPHCGEYQTLEFERVQWDKTEAGESTPAQAKKTARYVCAHCEQIVLDHHRPAMMKAGQWLADGEYVDALGNVCGHPSVESDTLIFGPLSKLYSLFIGGWGDVAREFVEAIQRQRAGDLESFRKFRTETLAESWTPTFDVVQPNALAGHLRGEHLRGQLPPESCFLTTAADVGLAGDELLFHWFVCAWWHVQGRAQGALVDWGLSAGVSAFLKWTNSTYPVVDRAGAFLPVAEFPIGIDSGKYTAEVYSVCDRLEQAQAFKGDSRTGQNVAVDLYYWGHRRTDKPAKLIAMQKQLGMGDLLMVNSHASQQYREALVQKRINRGDAGFVYFPADVCDNWQAYEHLFSQLNADYRDGNKWSRSGPNEAGDGIRYCRVLAEYYTRNGQVWDAVSFPERFSGQAPVAAQTVGRTDRPAQAVSEFHGSPFLLSQR